jgi:hypothetical protein
VIEINGPFWFFCALVVCGLHVLYLRGWRRDYRAYQAWWQQHDAQARQLHEKFLHAVGNFDSDQEEIS